jgi:prephenate dehydrogenase
MAGKELRGVTAAEAGLFEGRPYVLTPSNPGDLTYGPGAAFVELITTIGARPVILEPATHDRLVAYVSHLPQLMSTALASTLASVEKADNVAGPSVRDITRLALSPFDVWRDILVTNAGNVAEVLDEMIAKLKYIKETLVQEELRAIFDEAAGAAARVRKMN